MVRLASTLVSSLTRGERVEGGFGGTYQRCPARGCNETNPAGTLKCFYCANIFIFETFNGQYFFPIAKIAVTNALESAGMRPTDNVFKNIAVARAVLFGGTTHLPSMRKLVEQRVTTVLRHMTKVHNGGYGSGQLINMIENGFTPWSPCAAAFRVQHIQDYRDGWRQHLRDHSQGWLGTEWWPPLNNQVDNQVDFAFARACRHYLDGVSFRVTIKEIPKGDISDMAKELYDDLVPDSNVVATGNPGETNYENYCYIASWRGQDKAPGKAVCSSIAKHIDPRLLADLAGPNTQSTRRRHVGKGPRR